MPFFKNFKIESLKSQRGKDHLIIELFINNVVMKSTVARLRYNGLFSKNSVMKKSPMRRIRKHIICLYRNQRHKHIILYTLQKIVSNLSILNLKI